METCGALCGHVRAFFKLTLIQWNMIAEPEVWRLWASGHFGWRNSQTGGFADGAATYRKILRPFRGCCWSHHRKRTLLSWLHQTLRKILSYPVQQDGWSRLQEPCTGRSRWSTTETHIPRHNGVSDPRTVRFCASWVWGTHNAKPIRWAFCS